SSCTLATVLCLAGVMASGAGEKKAATGTLTVIDAKGKEATLKTWKLLDGSTMHLSWLAAPPADQKSKAPEGPQWLSFREGKYTTYQEGILTLVPLHSVRKIDYDNEKKTVTVTVRGAGDKDASITGSTKYKGLNKLTLEAEADLGELGVAAVKYHGGAPKDGIKGLRFADPGAGADLPKTREATLR